MKLLILGIFILIIQNSFSGVGDSGGGTVASLFNNPNLEIPIKYVKFRDNHSMSIDKVCREQARLRSKKKYPIYKEEFGRGNRDTRIKVKIGEDFKSIKNEREDGTFIYPVEYKDVPIRKKPHLVGNEDRYRFRRKQGKILFYRDFSIDFCTDVRPE